MISKKINNYFFQKNLNYKKKKKKKWAKLCHVTITFLKQGETKTSSGPIPLPLRFYFYHLSLITVLQIHVRINNTFLAELWTNITPVIYRHLKNYRLFLPQIRQKGMMPLQSSWMWRIFSYDRVTHFLVLYTLKIYVFERLEIFILSHYISNGWLSVVIGGILNIILVYFRAGCNFYLQRHQHCTIVTYIFIVWWMINRFDWAQFCAFVYARLLET